MRNPRSFGVGHEQFELQAGGSREASAWIKEPGANPPGTRAEELLAPAALARNRYWPQTDPQEPRSNRNFICPSKYLNEVYLRLRDIDLPFPW